MSERSRAIRMKRKGLADRLFPERQVFYRSHGQIRYIPFSPRQQILAFLVLLFIATWGVVFIAELCWHTYVSDTKIAEARDTTQRYQASLLEARKLETQARDELKQQNQRFQQEASSVGQRLAELEKLVRHIAGPQPVSTQAVSDQTVSKKTTHQDIQTAPKASNGVKSAHNNALDVTPSSEQDPSQLAMLVHEQDKLLTLAETAAEKKMDRAREAFETAGLNIYDVVGSGGPFISLEQAPEKTQTENSNSFTHRVAHLKERLQQGDVFEEAVSSAPFMLPLPEPYRITSRYGPRRDPFTGKPAFHAGLDFGHVSHTDIHASAPGKVIFAGWKRGYGKMIEIDHGHNFKTRYGHLSRSLVKQGDHVVSGQYIGVMGSTGRSSGPHLHYEVWFKNRSYNPFNFIKAGKHVQGQRNQG